MSNLPQLRQLMKTDQVQKQFEGMLKDNAASFITTVITNVSNNKSLQNVSPNSIILAAATSAALKLPVNPNLGYAAIIPFKGVAQLQVMVNGWMALAKRSGQVKKLICEPVHEGELIEANKFTEEYKFKDLGIDDDSKIIGFMCKLEEINGFEKTLYWDKNKVLNHGKKYSKTFSRSDSLWRTNFAAMGRKTILKHMLVKYATLSLELQTAIDRDEHTLEGEITDIKATPDFDVPESNYEELKDDKEQDKKEEKKKIVKEEAEVKPKEPTKDEIEF